MKKSTIIFWAILGAIIAIILAVSIFCIAKYDVKRFYALGASMMPTINEGDILVSFSPKGYIRGDVVVFNISGQQQRISFKRIVGLPGEKIDIKSQDGVYVNDKILDESYVQTTKSSFKDASVTLKNDEYFVLGDNAPLSADSREYGPIPRKHIVGKIIYALNGLKLRSIK